MIYRITLRSTSDISGVSYTNLFLSLSSRFIKRKTKTKTLSSRYWDMIKIYSSNINTTLKPYNNKVSVYISHDVPHRCHHVFTVLSLSLLIYINNHFIWFIQFKIISENSLIGKHTLDIWKPKLQYKLYGSRT